jgi:hypothetical protein
MPGRPGTFENVRAGREVDGRHSGSDQVPVSLHGARPDLAALGAGAIGGAAGLPPWVTSPGKYASPGQARAAQMAAQQAAAEDAAANQRKPLNAMQKAGAGMMTAGSSLADVFTFGGASKLLDREAPRQEGREGTRRGADEEGRRRRGEV